MDLGGFSNGLAAVSSVALGISAAKAAIERAKINPKQINEVIVGSVLSAGLGRMQHVKSRLTQACPIIPRQ